MELRETDSYRVGFDVGGTFTDFVLQAPSGELRTAKRLTTYPDPSDACLAGLDALMAEAGAAWTELAHAVHGTTLGSNIVIERKGQHVALLTTRGFRDVLIIGREKRYQVYDLQLEKPASLVPRRRIVEVTERIREAIALCLEVEGAPEQELEFVGIQRVTIAA